MGLKHNEDRVLLLHWFGGELCSDVTTSNFEESKSVLGIGYCYYVGLVESYVVLLLHQILKKTNQCWKIAYCYYIKF